MSNKLLPLIYLVLSIIFTTTFAQEVKKQVSKPLSINATNATPSRMTIISPNGTLMSISEQIDDNGNSFGVVDLQPATNDPNEPDSIKNRLWKDANARLRFSGQFEVDDYLITTQFQMKSGGGSGKVLTSGSNGQATWQIPSAAGSINGLSDGMATSDAGNLYLGDGAGTNDDSPGFADPSYNTGVGINALTTNGLVASQRGEKNTAVGYESLKNLDNNNGNENTAVGYQSHFYNASGTQNTAIGTDAMKGYSGGDENIALGYQAMQGGSNSANGEQNIAIGVGALANNISGDNNVAIGYKAGFAHTGDDQLFIQNRNITSYDPLIWGRFAPGIIRLQVNAENASTTNLFYVNGSAGGTSSWSGSSDQRLKKNIINIENSLDKVLKLRGVNFEWKDPENHRDGLQMGFIAQEALKVIPEVVDDESEYMSMQYAPITALLVEAIKEQQNIINEQNSKINSQEDRLSKLESLFDGKRFTKTRTSK